MLIPYFMSLETTLKTPILTACNSYLTAFNNAEQTSSLTRRVAALLNFTLKTAGNFQPANKAELPRLIFIVTVFKILKKQEVNAHICLHIVFAVSCQLHS